MFLLMSLGDGCLPLLLLSPVVVDRAALLSMASDSTAKQQAAQLAMLLRNMKCGCSAFSPQNSREAVAWIIGVICFTLGTGRLSHAARILPREEQEEPSGLDGVQGLQFASEFPNLL